MRRSLLAFLLLAGRASAATIATDPDYIITNWQVAEGLPDDSPNAMVQTPDGYLWFGTWNGLVRFDGTEFEVFDRGTTPVLPSSQIINLHLDHEGWLWISTTLGMAAVRDGVWRVFTHDHGWIGDYVRFFAEGNGRLFVVTFDCKLLERGDDGFREIAPPPVDPRHGMMPHVDPDGVLWIATPTGVYRRDGSQWQAAIPVEEGFLSAGHARDGGLWILTRGHVRKYHGTAMVFEGPGPGEGANPWASYEDGRGDVWLTSINHGVFLFSEGRWRHFDEGSGLAYHDARFAFEDREGDVWVGTSGGGLHRFRRRVFHGWGVAEGLPEPVVNSVTADAGGALIFGTSGHGLARLVGSRIERYDLGPSLDRAYVYSILADRHGRLWVGTYEHGFVIVEAGQQRLFALTASGRVGPWPTPGEVPVYSLFEDRRGRVWLGSEAGLTSFDGTRFETYALPKSSHKHLIRTIAEGPDGTLWAGDDADGVFRLDPGARDLVPAHPALANERIVSLHVDADGTLWIGTQDHGLVCLRGGRVTRLGEAPGLPARGVGAILDDGHGFLWLTSNHGIVRVARDQLLAAVDGRPGLAPQTFGTSDGLTTPQCMIGYQPTATIDAKGRLWFATIQGVVTADPSALALNGVPPPLVIREATVDGQPAGRDMPFSTTAARGLARVTLPPGAERLEVRYSGLSFPLPEKVRFRYQLVGLDNGWIDVGDQRVAHFQHLPPGRYELRVQAANNDGVWNETGAALALDVRPHVWQTLWFRLVAALLLLASVVTVTWRVGRAKLYARLERLEQQKALEREQARLASVLEATSDFVAFSSVRGDVLYVNQAGRRMLGLGDSDVRGLGLDAVHPPWAAAKIAESGIPGAIEHGTWSGETALRSASGDIPTSQVIVAHRAEDGTVDFLSTIARDISDMKGALQEKEILLKEIHHRVKNNLQIITSLLNLQASRVTESSVLGMLEDTKNRVHSMALLHERLFQSGGVAQIDVAEYLRSLTTNLLSSYGIDPRRVALTIDVAGSDMGVDTAVPCGLIVNELVSNALKHAYPNGGRGTIAVELQSEGEGRWRLCVRDDGIGWPESLDFRAARSLGMRLVQSLTRQLNGTIERTGGPGTAFEIRFADARYRARV